MAPIDEVLYHLLVVLNLGGCQRDCKLGCASRWNDLDVHEHALLRTLLLVDEQAKLFDAPSTFRQLSMIFYSIYSNGLELWLFLNSAEYANNMLANTTSHIH